MNRYELTYPSDSAQEPVLSKVILETKAEINIIRSKTDAEGGCMFIEIRGTPEKAKKVIKKFKELGVIVREIKKGIKVAKDSCIDCGACVSLCPTEVFSLDKDHELQVDDSKCITCKACIAACPVKALSIED